MNILITALEIIATVAILSGFTYLLIAVVKDFREDLKERKEHNLSRKEKYSNSFTETNTKLKELAKLTYESLAEAKKNQKAVELEAEEIFDNIEVAQKKFDTAKNKLTALMAEIETLSNNLITTEKEVKQLKINYEAALKTNGFETEDLFLK